VITCTGCALLCDDIEAVVENGNIKETRNACRRGNARLKGCKNRLTPTIDNKQVDIEACIKKAAEVLRNATMPMLFGFTNSTCEAQKKAIQLAKKLNAIIDDTSSFCQGLLMEKVLNKELKTCSLDEIRNKADVLIYWGSDAQNSQPRHLSRFTYFPRGELRQRGYEEDRIAIAIDVRESSTAKICKHFYKIPLKGDKDFMLDLMKALSGKLPKDKKMLELANIMKKAEFGAIFVGIGLTYSIKDDMDILVKLAEMLPNFNIMPMIGHYNMRGFNENLFKETGFVNSVRFNGRAYHDSKYSIVEAIKNKSIDALLVMGTDPVSSLPAHIIPNIPIICIDPCVTLTSKLSYITIPSALSGVECGGKAIRMDGTVIELTEIIDSNYMSDEEILSRIMEAI